MGISFANFLKIANEEEDFTQRTQRLSTEYTVHREEHSEESLGHVAT